MNHHLNTPIPSSPQIAARSLNALLQRYIHHKVPIGYNGIMGRSISTRNCPFRLEERHPNWILPVPGSTRLITPNGISIALTITSQYTTQTDRPIDKTRNIYPNTRVAATVRDAANKSNQPFNGRLSRTTQVSWYQKNINSLTLYPYLSSL